MIALINNLFETLCVKALDHIKIGHFRCYLDNKNYVDFGDPSSKLSSVMTIKNKFVWQRIVFSSVMGFAEGYMQDEVDVDDLATFLKICVANRDRCNDMELLPFGMNRYLNAMLNSSIPNTIYNAVFNIQAHYDLGNEFFSAFLDPTMMYSCPIWKDEKDDDLEGAQYRKVHRLLELCSIKKGMKVLEVGTGWGCLAIEAVKLYDCEVITVTLSKEQKRLAEERIRKAGLSSKITVLLCDYRNIDSAKYQFDRIVTCEMLEAVGPEFLPVFFKQADKLLNKNGIVSLQVITMPDNRYKEYCKHVDFIQKYIFPGGNCPSVTALVDAIYQGSEGRLIVDKMDNIGPHYSKCLRLWRERFVRNYDDMVNKTKMSHIYTQELKRTWEFYFAYCEVGFANRSLGDIQMRLSREANADLIDSIPF